MSYTKRRLKEFLKRKWFALTSPRKKAQYQIKDGDFESARATLDAEIRKNSKKQKTWLMLYKLEEKLGNRDMAEEAIRYAYGLNPDSTQILTAFGHFLLDAGKIDEARWIFSKTAQITPGNPVASFFLGIIEKMEGNFNAALNTFHHLASLSPHMAKDCWQEVCGLSLDDDRITAIRDAARKCDRSPEFFVESMLRTPHIALDEGDIDVWINRINQSLSVLLASPPSINKPERLFHLHFFVMFAMQDINILPLRERFSRLLGAMSPELSLSKRAQITLPQSMSPRRIRVGISMLRCSNSFFHNAYKRFLSGLDRLRFEVTLIRPPAPKDNEFVIAIDSYADNVITYPDHDWRTHHELVKAYGFDILLHETISILLSIGFTRLAPIQCGFFDYQESMGTPQQDYMLIYGDSKRQEELRPWYREKTALLSNMFTWAEIGFPKAARISKQDLGIPSLDRFIFTFQQLFRWRVKDDHIVITLLWNNPDLHLVVAAIPSWDMGSLVVERWRRKCPEGVARRIVLIPSQPQPRFFGIVNLAEFIIAPPIAPGGISLSTTISMGVPMVVGCGTGVNSSLGALAYQAIGVEGLVAKDTDEYIAIAQRLLNDKEWRETKSREISENASKLYQVEPQIRELEDFLEAAHHRAVAGLPPMNWREGKFVE